MSKLRPVVASDWWRIGPSPDLSHLGAPLHDKPHEMVDHHLFRDASGKWNLWGCIRQTPVGRILYHWQADCLRDKEWRKTGEMIRCDRSAGECQNDGKSEQIQSPFIVRHHNFYYMLYGGVDVEKADWAATETDLAATFRVAQMCLMTSPDGQRWTRHKNSNGYSRIFIGPGATRDPSLICIDNVWHCYYAGFHDSNPLNAGVYLRTSRDLITWSEWSLVHFDTHFHHHPYMAECPTVIFHEGWYYLFRTENYPLKRTYVFRSKSPRYFGVIGDKNYDVNDYFVGVIPVGAPEIIADETGQLFITSNHDLCGGTLMAELGWVNA